MQINVTFDQNPNSLPAGFVAAIDFVVNYYDSIFTSNVAINIHVGFGEIDGQALGSNALGESSAPLVLASYSSVRAALLAQGAPGDTSLPSSSPDSGSLLLAQAEAQALGLTSAVSTSYVGFSSTAAFSYTANATPASSQYYFIGVVEHEFSEDMGRFSMLDNQPSYYSPMDLFRYSSAGVRDLTTGGAGSTAYFSINNGASNLGTWNNQTSNGDLGDWYPAGPAAGGNDAYNDYSYPGVINTVSADDITLMNALGWGSGIVGTGPSTTTVVTGDFTGDGKTDIAVIGSGLGGIATYVSNGNGTFHGAFSSQTGTDWVDLPNAKVLTGDFNGDGKVDLAVIDYGLGGVGTYLSNGNGTFTAVFSSQTGSDWSSWPNAKAVTGDFNGDGKTDIAVIDYGLGGIATYLSNGNGTFAAVYSSETGTDWSSWPNATPIIGDFNGDGKTDIAVIDFGLGGIGTYLSNGNGTFHPVYSSETGTDWSSWPNVKAVTGDFNGDGKTDIAVIDYGLGGIGTYLSNGDGTFRAVYSSQTGTDWSSWPNAKVVTGDFNGDGKTDIAVIDYGLGGIGTYLSNGDGTFHAVYSSQTGTDWCSWPDATAITGDFNGDGKTDIEVISPTLGGIAIYLSNGDGTFHAVFSAPGVSNGLSASQQNFVTTVWSSPGDGSWSDSSNWSAGAVPGQSDYVNITQSVTVTFDDSHDSIAGLVVGDAATLAVSANDLLDVSGALIDFGTLTVASGGLLQLDGSADTNSGSILLDGILDVASALTLNGNGAITLAGGTIESSATGGTLVNAGNTISGTGTIGDGTGHLALDNASGTIEASGGTLIIDTGTTIINTGVLEAAAGATLKVDDAVTGTGSSTIGTGATIEFAAANSGSVTFNSSTGGLILDHSSLFSGEIFNFTGDGSLSGSDQIDLKDINESSLQASYANGVLTVTDGTHTANLDFDGSYVLANFKFASDGSGGTLVYDPPVPASNPQALASSTAAIEPPAEGVGHVTIAATEANATLTGNGSNDTFVFAANIGQATIKNFAPATDAIQLGHAIFANAAAALSAARNDGYGNVVIADASHDIITLQHTSVSQLHQSDFLIV